MKNRMLRRKKPLLWYNRPENSDKKGGASMQAVIMAGGKGTLVGTFIGVLIYQFLRNALNLLGINPFWQGFVTGIVIIVAVLADSLSSHRGK